MPTLIHISCRLSSLAACRCASCSSFDTPGMERGPGIPAVPKLRNLLICILLFISTPAFADLTLKGIDYISWERDEFLHGDPILERVAGLGTNCLAVVVTLYQDTYKSDSIYCDPAKTPSDLSIAHAVTMAQSLGLSVMLRLQVDSKDDIWRGYFQPTSTVAWFDSYRTAVSHYARLADSLGVDELGIGCEYKSLSSSSYRGEWAVLVAKVRADFHGPIIYCANWDEYQTVSFWDLLNEAGVDVYFPLSDAQHPSVNELHHGYFNYVGTFGAYRWVSDLRAWQQQIAKPVILTEVGFRNVDFVAKEPWNVNAYTIRDDSNQANAYEATFRAFIDETWCRGLFWWCCTPTLPEPANVGWEPLNKPAESVISFWYHGGKHPIPAGDLTILLAYPNPARQKITFGRIPGSTEISVYNILGWRVRRLTKDDDLSMFIWDLKDERGIICPSGVYLCLFRSFQEYRKAKVFIVK